MGLAKQRWMEQQEEDYLEEKAAWIRERLEDPEADENSEGWSDLSEEYEQLSSQHERDYYEDDLRVVGKSRIDIFEENIKAARDLLQISSAISSAAILRVMLHAHVVSAVEAYLSSTFIEHSLCSDVFMQQLVETDPEFAKRKFTMKEIFIKRESLKDDLQAYLKDLIFHNLDKVQPMYQSVLSIDFGDITWLFQAVALRHDCVHRAGFDKEGNAAPISYHSISDLIAKCDALVHKIESEVKGLPSAPSSFWNLDTRSPAEDVMMN